MQKIKRRSSKCKLTKVSKLANGQIFFIQKIKNQRKWTEDEDRLLINYAKDFKEKNWKEISLKFANKNPLQCFSRYKRIRPGIIKGSWKKEEDIQIRELIKKYGKSWSKISKIMQTRNGKQIRDRYINVLSPGVQKCKFTEDEDEKLILLFQSIGPKWAKISKYFENRTADMIKNRFHSSLKRKLSEDSQFEQKTEVKNNYLIIILPYFAYSSLFVIFNFIKAIFNF
jgi:myb proto-oncogene protein